MITTKKLLFVGTLFGRGFGYLRELSIVFLFGISQQADDVIFLLTSFDSLSAVFSYGTITLLSLSYIKQKRASFKELKHFFLLIGFLYAILCSCFIYFNSGVLNWGMIIPFIALLNIDYSMNLSIQQNEDDFLWTAFTNFLINVILIICIFVFPNYLLFTLILTISLYLRNYLIKTYNIKKFDYIMDSVKISKQNKKMFILTIFGTGVFYLIPIIDRFVASSYGQMAVFNYADRIMIFAAVLVNLIFIYPSIIENNKSILNLKYLIIKHRILLGLCLLFSVIPFIIVSVNKFNFEYEILHFITFSSIHFLHFITFLILLSLIQIWTVKSNFKNIILISFFLIILRLPFSFLSSDISIYTSLILIIEILLISVIFFLKK